MKGSVSHMSYLHVDSVYNACMQLYKLPTRVYYATSLGQTQNIKNGMELKIKTVGMQERRKLANLTLAEFEIVHQVVRVEQSKSEVKYC